MGNPLAASGRTWLPKADFLDRRFRVADYYSSRIVGSAAQLLDCGSGFHYVLHVLLSVLPLVLLRGMARGSPREREMIENACRRFGTHDHYFILRLLLLQLEAEIRGAADPH